MSKYYKVSNDKVHIIFMQMLQLPLDWQKFFF